MYNCGQNSLYSYINMGKEAGLPFAHVIIKLLEGHTLLITSSYLLSQTCFSPFGRFTTHSDV